MNLDAARTYAERSELHALLAESAGRRLVEAYGAEYGPDKPHALYSGTKSFWGPLSVRAQSAGLFSLDEPVGETFVSWSRGPRRAVTLRMLLQLIAGIPFGGLGASVPPYDKALQTQLREVPGTVFTYGGIPLQVFGAVLAAKIAPKTPHQLLHEMLLDDAGVQVAQWRILKDGTQPLPTGAFLTAPMWLRYGRFILSRQEEFAECFNGSSVNPGYGLGWWLAGAGAERAMYASGSGGQALYLLPEHDAAIVHFGKSPSWRHETFLRYAFGRKPASSSTT
jgi:CubicO group peptidase (beta-lactamase class C family)